MRDEFAIGTVYSRAPAGLAAPLVRVEVYVGTGLPAFLMVGLPETVVRESRERVRSALITAGFDFPAGRITVSLAPADLPKEGGRFDLPIAVGILAASEQLPRESLAGREFYGELSLNGDLCETPRLLPALIAGARAGAEVILPAANALEASLAGNPNLRLAHRLMDVCETLRGRARWPPPPTPVIPLGQRPQPDLIDVRGQPMGKRALEVAAAGGHGLLMIGSPGTGKTLLAQRLPGLLPPLDAGEALEVASLESSAGRRPSASPCRPFRSPQHTASEAALIGGHGFRPGELSLAHHGVLFLDELPEFARNALEAMREPLESGVVLLARAKHSYEFPARFQLIAAMNPCPCGYAGEGDRCRCTAAQVGRYRNKLSGPLLDRIDMHIQLQPLTPDQLMGPDPAPGETSGTVAARVAAARERQLWRQGKLNSRLNPVELDRFCRLDGDARRILRETAKKRGLSARAFHAAIKVARTCADLAQQPDIQRAHVSEALNLRALDQMVV